MGSNFKASYKLANRIKLALFSNILVFSKPYYNSPDTFGNVAGRIMAYTLAGLDHFIQVSLLPDLKMMPENKNPCHSVIPRTKNCPEYCY
jgi:hypothetical protein